MTVVLTNGALAVHHTATVNTPWDGPGAVAAMSNDPAVLKYCHTWQDSNGKPDAKTSYKMPHHKTEGGPANMAACRNGLARLSGSSIPAADQPGVERHLRTHLSDGGNDEPDALNRYEILAKGRQRARAGRREWFTIRATTDDDGPAQVFIYDEIGGGGFFGGGITAQDFVADLVALKATAIDLHINSPGGDVFDAVAIYNAVRRHPATVTTYVDGLAASAASFIAQAGDRVLVERNAQFMVHDAAGICFGNAADMQAMTDLLNKASDNIADIYSQRTGVDAGTWRAVMRAEAWYSSSEAVTAGLADGVVEDSPVADERLTARSRFDLSAYRYKCREEAPDPVSVMVAARTAGRLVAEDLTAVVEAVANPAPVPAPPEPDPDPEEVPVLVPSPLVPELPEPVADPDPAPTVPAQQSVFDPDAFRAALRIAVAQT